MMLSFGEAVRLFYGNYLNADGRAQRSAYWWVFLYQLIISLVFAIVILMAEGGPELINSIAGASTTQNYDNILAELSTLWADLGFSGKAAFYCMMIFNLLNFIPDIMMRIRRFHDLGQSGWLVLAFFMLGMIPLLSVVSGLANIVWFAIPGTQGTNQYGPDPLGYDTDMFG